MKQNSLFALSLMLILPSAFADNSRFEQVLSRNDNAYQLHCEVSDRSNFISSVEATSATSFKQGAYLFRKFQLNTQSGAKEFTLQVYPHDGDPMFQAVIDGVKVGGEVREGVGNHAKKQMNFSHNLLGKVTCFAEFAYEPNFRLGDGQHHINVHPHGYYDYRGLTVQGTNRLYDDANYQSLMLLEDHSWKEGSVNLVRFLLSGRTGLSHRDPGTIMVNVPADAAVKVSPAGHNRYRMEAQQKISVTYTGGNHNYCIWNNTRRLLNALMETETAPVLDIIYKQNSIVAQQAGILGGGMSFSGSSIRRSNLLADLLQDSGVAKSYHAAYFNFFARVHFGPYTHRFATLTLNYQAPGYSEVVVLNGSGKRHLKVNFRYQ